MEVLVRFCLRATTVFGEAVGLVGNAPGVLSWDPSQAVILSTNRATYPVWSVALQLRSGSPIEYKYVILRDRRLVRWEGFQGNRSFSPAGARIEVDDGSFGANRPPTVTVLGAEAAEPCSAALPEVPAPGRDSSAPESAPRVSSRVTGSAQSPAGALSDQTRLPPSRFSPLPAAPRVPSSSIADTPVRGGSAERAPAVSRSPSGHSYASRKGPHATPPNPANDPGFIETDEFVLRIKEENNKRPSWRQKLDFIRELFADPSFVPSTGNLANLAIYLYFVNTGEVPCFEGGGHHRPNNHANTSRAIEDCLSKISGPDNLFILRKIYPLLPSYASAYTQPVPLTRIRDIAHHKDTPREFKLEIKHTLQNKLHRCAGPEDLVTSADILRRITTPGTNYPDIFISQFRLFHQELLEFFNATGLEDHLNGMVQRGEPDSKGCELIRAFLHAKQHGFSFAGQGAQLQQMQFQGDKLITLMRLTSVREHLAAIINGEEGLHITGDTFQRIRIADIRMEEYAFVVLSELINSLGADGHRRLDKDSWARAIAALGLTVRNVGLGGVDAEECKALYNEFKSFGSLDPSVRSELLGLKATVDRAYRLADDFSQRVLNLFTERAHRLGHLVQVDPVAVRVFCESNIRSHLIFQLSKLLALVLKEIRIRLQLSPFEAIVSGSTVGVLVKADRIDDLPGLSSSSAQMEISSNAQEKVIAFVDRAEGEEEIPRFVAGIILGHELPHLSHLGVRARQEGVVFAICDDPDTFQVLKDSAEARGDNDHRPLLGSKVILEVKGDDSVKLKHFCEDSCLGSRATLGAVVHACSSGSGHFPAEGGPVASSPFGGNKRNEIGIGAVPLAGRGVGVTTVAERLPKVQAAPVDLLGPNCILHLNEVRAETGGAKADSARKLAQLAEQFQDPLGYQFKAPCAVVVPFSIYYKALQDGPAAEYEQLVAESDALPVFRCAEPSQRLQELLRGLPVPTTITSSIKEFFVQHASSSTGRPLVMVRSSANVEDLEKVSGAGLYDSIAGVDPFDEGALARAIQAVWASLWTKRATISRRQTGLDHRAAYMSVLIMDMVVPADYSFIMMTRNPISGSTEEIYLELAVGLGETLCSGVRGTPYRLVCNKVTRDCRILSFATFSFAFKPNLGQASEVTAQQPSVQNSSPDTFSFSSAGASPGQRLLSRSGLSSGLVRQRIDYSSVKFSSDAQLRTRMSSQLAAIGIFLEQQLGGPQDVEGLFSNDVVFLVQSRPLGTIASQF